MNAIKTLGNGTVTIVLAGIGLGMFALGTVIMFIERARQRMHERAQKSGHVAA